ncbi:MAG TPA: hypothetical protein VJ694_04150 [Patescibacteria group bacterium]|nr:hypothetical protein [Patescibacteria group bacterium]
MLRTRSKGVVALVTVLIVMATLVSLGLVIAAVGRDEIILARVVEKGETAFAIADACLEEGLQRLKSDAGYAGGSFVVDEGACVVTVSNLGGDVRQVRGQGTSGDAIRIVEARVTLLSNAQGDAKKVKIEWWREAD